MALREYRDPVIGKLIEMLEQYGPAELRGHYVYGDVLAPNKNDLPVVSISFDDTVIESDGTMQDTHTKSIYMAIIYDWTTDLDQSFDLSRGTTGLYKLIEQRDDSYRVVPNSIAYVLRKYQKLDDNVFIAINNDRSLRIDYALGTDKRGINIFSIEGILRFNIEVTQPKPQYYQ